MYNYLCTCMWDVREYRNLNIPKGWPKVDHDVRKGWPKRPGQRQGLFGHPFRTSRVRICTHIMFFPHSSMDIYV